MSWEFGTLPHHHEVGQFCIRTPNKSKSQSNDASQSKISQKKKKFIEILKTQTSVSRETAFFHHEAFGTGLEHKILEAVCELLNGGELSFPAFQIERRTIVLDLELLVTCSWFILPVLSAQDGQDDEVVIESTPSYEEGAVF